MFSTNLTLEGFLSGVEVYMLVGMGADVERLLAYLTFIFRRTFVGSHVGFSAIF